jgi:hypothetical protein
MSNWAKPDYIKFGKTWFYYRGWTTRPFIRWNVGIGKTRLYCVGPVAILRNNGG